MLPLLVLSGVALSLSPSASTATVYVHVVPYIDSDAWSQDHIIALKEFLSWCEKRKIKVAVFHYNTCESDAPGITNVIREYAERDTISLVGLHSTSHALGGLPLSLQYWELKFNLQFLRNRVKTNVVPVLSVPSWVFDTNTLYVCDMLGIRVIICGADITNISSEYDPKWDGVDSVARHMPVGYFNVHGDRLYYIPAMDFYLDLLNLTSNNVTLRGLLQNAVKNLINNGIINATSDVHLTLWVLIHPWELADANVLQEFEKFLSDIRDGLFNFEYKGTKITFELSDPREVVDTILSRKSNLKFIPLPEPDYSRILKLEGFYHWWELIKLYPDKSELVWMWLDTMYKWQTLDSALWDLTVNGDINDSFQKNLYRAVKLVWNEALLNDVLRHWNSDAVRELLLKERKYLDVVYRDTLILHAELMGSMVRQNRVELLEQKVNQIKQDIKEIKENLKRISQGQQDLKRQLESLEQEIQELKRQESKRGLPMLPVPLPWKRRNHLGRRRSRRLIEAG
ncbi:hypothetical protein [Methanopyrus sp.]